MDHLGQLMSKHAWGNGNLNFVWAVKLLIFGDFEAKVSSHRLMVRTKYVIN